MFHHTLTKAKSAAFTLATAAALSIGSLGPAAADENSRTQVCPVTTSAASPAAHAPSNRRGGNEHSRTVSLADLDLSTAGGLATARERIHQVARRLCGEVASSLDLSHQTNFVACVHLTMENASRQLARPALAAAAVAEPSGRGQP